MKKTVKKTVKVEAPKLRVKSAVKAGASKKSRLPQYRSYLFGCQAQACTQIFILFRFCNGVTIFDGLPLECCWAEIPAMLNGYIRDTLAP